MDNNKLGKKIHEWATSLGFRLSDGSTPSPDYFALLTATPQRRQLWETIVETVQPRHKIEQMRKQILVAKLLNKKKFTKVDGSKQFTDRIELWEKKIKLENEIKDKKMKLIQLEKNILGKSSDLLFEICKLAECEKQMEETDEKSMVVFLNTKRETKILEDFKINNLVLKEISTKNSSDIDLENLKLNELINAEKCDNVDDHSCKLLHSIKELNRNGYAVEFLWNEMIKYHVEIFEKFTTLLKDLHSTVSHEKKKEIEKKSSWLINQIKQKATEKSLQTILNSTEGKLLDLDIEKFQQKLLKDSEMENENLNENISFYSLNESETHKEREGISVNVKNYVNMIGMESYRNFLQEEITRSKEEIENEKMRKNNKAMEKRSCDEIDKCFKDFETIFNEINKIKSEDQNTEKRIILAQEKIQSLISAIAEEAEEKFKSNELEKTVENLKSNCRKRIDEFLEIPMNAFKTVENVSGRIEFECESYTHCLKNYGGEFKQIFSAILIPPTDNLDQIISDINRRKRILNRIKTFISENNSLTENLNKTNEKIGNIVWNSDYTEKNYNESNVILTKVLTDSNELMKETAFLEKILNNWVEQPYRSMIRDTIDGKSLKEFEEDYKKRKSDWFL